MNNFCLSLDWLGFTFVPDITFDESPITQFVKMFPELEQIVIDSEQKKCKSHYDVMYSWNNDVFFAYNIFDEESKDKGTFERRWRQGVNVQIPSHSIELFFNCFGLSIGDDTPIVKLFKILKHRRCKLSRIDLCYDDFSKTYSPSDYMTFALTNRLQSRYIDTAALNGSRSGGQTFSLGSQFHRRKFMRVYDKYKESKGAIDSIRYEYECHNEGANEIFEYILNMESDSIPFASFTQNWLRVKKDNKSSNLSMVDDDQDWIRFLCETVYDILPSDLQNRVRSGQYIDINSQFNAILAPIKIPRLRSEFSDVELSHFINYQAMPSITGYIELYGLPALLSEVHKCRKHNRINNRYLNELNRLKASGFNIMKQHELTPFEKTNFTDDMEVYHV